MKKDTPKYENGRKITLEESSLAFVTMFALLKCAMTYKEFLTNGESLVDDEYKEEITHMAKKVRHFINRSNGWFEGENKSIWDADWSRDSGGIAIIMEKFIMMDDNRRALLEEVTESIFKGTVQAEQGFIALSVKVPDINQEIEFFTDHNAIPHWGSMQDANVFYSIRMQKHFFLDEVLCWKPYTTYTDALKQAGIEA